MFMILRIIEYAFCVEVNTTSGVVKGLTIDVLNTSVDQFLAIPYAEPPVGVLRFAKPVPLRHLEYTVCIEVNTTSGVVKGLTIDVLNTSVDQFLAIPYAEPPVGVLRFAKSVPLRHPIQDVIDGTETGNSCYQLIPDLLKPFVGNLTLSEDCLVLNVWTPHVAKKSVPKAPLKPVMFWIHGGALILGSSFQKLYNGTALATNDVVVVSINYRLANFGFLYGDREDAPGNVGFYDQLLALKWVRENIHMFGGDRDEITIFGESAGSWSVSVQLLSPLSKGLFKRAIMESGAHMFNKDRDIKTAPEALNEAKQLAVDFNCSKTSVEWLECLRQLNAEDLNEHIGEGFTVATLGTEYLPVSAHQAFQTKQFN
ncbi:unnamed protein product, partial [Medioppia subpectinata]